MASNFKVCGHQTEGSVHLKLLGDLDDSSVLELIDILKKGHRGLYRVFIHTAGLEDVSPVACGNLRSNLLSLKMQSDRLAFTGEYAARMAPNKDYLM